MAMSMAVVSAVNPAASSLLTSNTASIPAVAQNNDQAHEEETSDIQQNEEVEG
jgi:hypothetical protein